MKTVNALKIRNHLGEVLNSLDETGEPIVVSKGREIRAVLITPEQFQRRFLDYQTDEKKQEVMAAINKLKEKRLSKKSSVAVLRELRGYAA
jgi:PHD/YefM family antitoxin component YafN of YafNO toxin-antitoxin module